MSKHPQIIEKEGKREFVVLPYEESLAIKEILEDYEDLKDLRKAKKEAEGQSSVRFPRSGRISFPTDGRINPDVAKAAEARLAKRTQNPRSDST